MWKSEGVERREGGGAGADDFGDDDDGERPREDAKAEATMASARELTDMEF